MEDSFIGKVITIWVDGGSLMPALAFISLLLYSGVFELWLYLSRHNYFRSDQNEWAHWVDRPEDAHGDIGNVVRFVQEGVRSVPEIRGRFAEVRTAHLPPVEHRILFINILIGIAPLTGLLGTVTGMLATFLGLSISRGSNAIDLVAGGISEALITTMVGLVLAIPGYVMVSQLRKQMAELDLFFTRLEILTILKFERKAKELKAV